MTNLELLTALSITSMLTALTLDFANETEAQVVKYQNNANSALCGQLAKLKIHKKECKHVSIL